MSYELENNLTRQGLILEENKEENCPLIQFYSNFVNNQNFYK